MIKNPVTKAPRNRSIFLTAGEEKKLSGRLTKLSGPASIADILGKTICQDVFEIFDYLPEKSVDLVIADPPYNLTKKFNNFTFRATHMADYQQWLESWIEKIPRLLKDTGSLYICGDWRSSPMIFLVLQKYFIVRNRITWEREKGRGAKTNWKNAHEDIWFATLSKNYTFNVDDVKIKRRVLAPYKENGRPKDWTREEDGNFRLTHPSNLWNDITIPFWSMPENTDHPTQKPEKLIAKLVLAGSNENDVVFDPFLGSGTTSVVSKKLKRRYFGVEREKKYCLLAEKRLDMADCDASIQGYADGIFRERNTPAGKSI